MEFRDGQLDKSALSTLPKLTQMGEKWTQMQKNGLFKITTKKLIYSGTWFWHKYDEFELQLLSWLRGALTHVKSQMEQDLHPWPGEEPKL